MSIVNLLIAARNAVSEFRQRQRAYAELGALDDRSLADIGLRRSDIPAVIEGLYDATRERRPAARGDAAFDPRHAQAVAGHRWMPPL